MKSMSENTDIWENVNEKTIKLMILDGNVSKGSRLRFKKYKIKINVIDYRTRILEPPESALLSLQDHPEIKLTNLKNMPQNLPNLESIVINLNSKKSKLKFLTGMPKSLPKLKTLRILGAQIQSLKGIPSELPSLEKLHFSFIPLDSLEHIPNSLPKLHTLEIYNTSIQTLEYFPTDTPNLKEIHLAYNRLVSLKGLPSYIPALEKLNVSNNQLTSLDNCPHKFKPNKFNPDWFPVNYRYNPIRTLSGIKNPRFIEFLDKSLINSLQLCPAFLKLFEKYTKLKLELSIKRAKYNEYDEYVSGCIPTLSHEYDDVEMPTAEDFERYKNEIAALKTTVTEFYRKTPMELAQQYVENPDSLTDTELERLGWEGGYKERQMLESTFPPDNPLLNEISQRFTHKLLSGLSILK